jgi:hypothetical protein
MYGHHLNFSLTKVHFFLQFKDMDADRCSVSSSGSSGSNSSTTSSSFHQSREIWRKRENSESSSSSPAPPAPLFFGLPLQQKHTPDLVMDLPLNSSTSVSPSGTSDEFVDDASPATSPVHSGPESPDMTAAERFAKQNQCTLKKKDARTSSSSSSGSASAAIDAQTQTKVGEKPPLKAKPQLMLKKPGQPPSSPDLNKSRELNK